MSEMDYNNSDKKRQMTLSVFCRSAVPVRKMAIESMDEVREHVGDKQGA